MLFIVNLNLTTIGEIGEWLHYSRYNHLPRCQAIPLSDAHRDRKTGAGTCFFSKKDKNPVWNVGLVLPSSNCGLRSASQSGVLELNATAVVSAPRRCYFSGSQKHRRIHDTLIRSDFSGVGPPRGLDIVRQRENPCMCVTFVKHFNESSRWRLFPVPPLATSKR